MPIVIEAQVRVERGKNANRRLRKAGRIPAVIYGPGKEPLAVSVKPEEVRAILHSETGRNTIFTVSVDGSENNNAMLKDYQLDPVRGELIHADFLQIAMDRALQLTVNVEIVGEAEGVKIGGVLDFVTRSVEVECLPSDIPESIKVDVTHLKVNDCIRVKDIQVPPKISIVTDPEVVIATVIPPVKEVAPVEAAPEAAEPEIIKKGKAVEEGLDEEQSSKASKS